MRGSGGTVGVGRALLGPAAIIFGVGFGVGLATNFVETVAVFVGTVAVFVATVAGLVGIVAVLVGTEVVLVELIEPEYDERSIVGAAETYTRRSGLLDEVRLITLPFEIAWEIVCVGV